MNELKFEKNTPRELIEVGVIYKHTAGLTYRVEGIGLDINTVYKDELHNATGYESGKEPRLFNVK